MVSSATLAAFSKPVHAKKASETPASTARTGEPSAVNCSSTPGSLTPVTRAMMPMIMTMTRPLSSMKVMMTFTITDSVMPIRLMMVTIVMKTSATMVARQIDSGDSPTRPAEVAHEARRQRPHRGHVGRQHADGDEERQEGAAEGLVDVERGAGGLRVLGDQLGVREAGDEGDRDAGQEGHPEGPADGRGDQPDEDVDARAEDVADHVEVQLLAGDRAFQLTVLEDVFGGGVRGHARTLRDPRYGL